jgi:hypothetical protein
MKGSAKILRVIAILLLGMTAGINLLGGAGTFCAAFSNNVGYRMAFKDIMDYRWLYQVVMVLTIPTGIAGVFALVKLIRGKSGAFKFSMIILIIGTILGATQFIASMVLRGKATPANVKFFTNIATLVYFAILQIPGIRKMLDDSGPVDKSETNAAGGLVAFLAGILTLTVFFWAGPSHTFFGENWTFVFETPLVIAGTVLLVGGFLIVLREILSFVSGYSSAQSSKLLKILVK